MQNYIGKQIDRYRITERLGQGGMAVVYKAYDIRLERDVAIKFIRIESVSQERDDRLILRFQREARAMAKLVHPNIVQVMDYGEFEGTPYLVMPYLSGGTLKSQTGSPMPYRQAASLLAPIADALAYAHSQGIIHRDIKPANILITESGTPMLSDFGIAKLLEEQDVTLTSTGFGVGTPHYMAPEQVDNKVVPQTDIYALGTIFYELVTGKKPYDAETPAAILVKRATEPLVRPRTFISNLPEEVEKVIFKAMAYKSENRYSQMQDFGSALNQLSSNKFSEFAPLLNNGRSSLYQTDDYPTESTTVDQIEPNALVPDQSSLPTKRKRPYWIMASLAIIAVLCLIGSMLVISKLPGLLGDLFSSNESKVSEENSPAPLVQINTTEVKFTLSPTPTGILTPTATEKTAAEVLTVGSSFIRKNDEMLVMYIPEGSFLMGSANSDSNASADEKPQHEVYLDAFWMDAYEISNEMFVKFVQETGYQTAAEEQGYSYMYSSSGAWAEYSGVNWRHPMGENTTADSSLPVVHVNYYDATAYCAWAGGRLPTEAEWEKAARGEDGRLYPWGNTFASANLRYNASGGPISIYSFPESQSPYGVFNMAGNVFEWTNDWYNANYYSNSPTNNPTGPSNGDLIALRSGGWNSSQSNVRIANRDVSGPDYMNYLLGFRCAMSAD